MTSTRITTQFGATSTAAEVIAGVDLTGRRAVVTGASTGIGVETARALASANAEVTLAVRDVDAGRTVAADIIATTGNEHVQPAPLDLSDQDSVAAFVADWDGPLHILVNNAGVMATPELRTREGWEMQFATNHLGHFALTTGRTTRWQPPTPPVSWQSCSPPRPSSRVLAGATSRTAKKPGHSLRACAAASPTSPSTQTTPHGYGSSRSTCSQPPNPVTMALPS
jgi:NAD(P)-dependent dehydrogenase (short-subunit alcohol dehydrogenase family)